MNSRELNRKEDLQYAHSSQQAHDIKPGKRTVWFEKQKGKAIFLFDAENEHVIEAFFAEIPLQIVEIDNSVLSKIEDQLELNAAMTRKNVFKKDFLLVMAVRICVKSINPSENEVFKSLLQQFNTKITKTINRKGGKVRRLSNEYLLVSFKSAKNAIKCALRLRDIFNKCKRKIELCKVSLNIGIGLKKLKNNHIATFENEFKRVRRMSYIAENKIFITPSVRKQYRNEMLENINNDCIAALDKTYLGFIDELMECMEKNWQNEHFMVKDLEDYMNCSKSRFYRKMMKYIGLSPNSFIKEYRLYHSTELMLHPERNISEVAYKSGFNSPSYFTKCFQKRFGLKPSEYQLTMSYY